MKKLLILLPLLMLWSAAFSQVEMPKPRAVERTYRDEYRAALRTEENTIERLKEEGWAIILPIEERVPTEVMMGATTIDHWAKGILLPPELVSRLVAECVEPVVGKISDTGVEEIHPELSGAWWLPGTDYTGDDPTPLHLHGTHVAGISFSLLEPLIRAGRVQLKDCRVLNSDGAGNFTWAASMLATERKEDQAFEQAGKHVVYNMSWGGQVGTQPAMEKELENSAALGITFVAAAGNNGAEVPSYPASSNYVLATASLDKALTVSSYSTRGTFVDNAMPGRDINSTVPGGGFATLSGTSMASPMLFSAVVIAKSKWGDKIPDVAAMHRYLAAIGSDIPPTGWDKAAGWGLVYIYKILDTDPASVIGNPPPPPPPPPPAELNTIVFEDGGYVMKWSKSGDKVYRNILIPWIRLSYTGAGTAETLYDDLDAWIPTYFKNRALILSSNMDASDAAYYTGRFLELIAADQTKKIDVLEIKGIDDEKARTFYVEVGATLPKAIPKGEKVSITVLE